MGYELQYQLFALIFQVMINQKKTNKNDCIYHLIIKLDNLINFILPLEIGLCSAT